MSKREVKLLLDDMLIASNRIVKYTNLIGFEDFIKDEKTIDATVRNIQILGEAAAQITKEFQNTFRK